MRRARFAWETRVPLGALTLLAGTPGQGKSHLAVWLGARISRGQLPGDLQGVPSDVLIASAEDPLSFVLKPRFVAAGADLERVHSVAVHRDGIDLGIAIPDDVEGIESAMLGCGSKLLIVDPLLAHIPVRIDGYKDQHVRVALSPLARLAEKLDAAVLAVMHLNKRETADLFSRLGGSGGFLGAARSALLVAPDPEEPEVRVVAHGKANFSREAESLRFRLQEQQILNPDPADSEPIRAASIVLAGESGHKVEALLRTNHATAKPQATAWLEQMLSNGPKAVELIKSSAEEAGHAWRTVERAKSALEVKAQRVGGLGNLGRWHWSL